MNQNTNTEDTIDLKELFFSLIAQWKLIALCIILSLVCALLYLRVTPDTYSVDALVQVEDSKGASAALLGDLSQMIEQKSPAQAEIEILKSRLVLGSVIRDLHLNIRVSSTENTFTHRLLSNTEYKTEYNKNSVVFKDGLKSFEIRQFEIPAYYLDKTLHLNFDKQSLRLTDPTTEEVILNVPLNQLNQVTGPHGTWKIALFTKDQFDATYNITNLSVPAAVNAISANYSVAERGKLTGVLGLNYQGQDKEQITKVLNAILATYSAQNIERRSAESAQTLKFLDEQLPDLKKQLDDAERQFNKFRQQYNTVDVTKESELYLTQSITLETKKAELEQKQAEMAAKYTAEHPAMREINGQITAINKQIGELNSTLKQLPDVQRQYLQLYREVEVKTQLYTALLNSYQQLRIAKAGEIGNVRIVDTAVEPIEPIKPKKFQILVLSLFLGGFIGTLVALLRNMLRTGIKDSGQIENELDLPVYATVPRSPIQESRIKILKKKKSIPILAVKNSDDIAIESLRSIRTAIHFALANAKNNIIMIAGPSPEVGKSFISTNLATIFAQGDKRVLLIDADMRRGYMHKYFDVDVKPGLSELLSGQADLQNVLHKTPVANLDVITRGKSPTNPSEILSSNQFKELLEQLQSQYDHIIIDTPPVLAVTDGIIISQYTGVNLIVARYAKSQMKELELTLNRFEQAGVKVNGFILNDIQRASAGYGYGYNYAYAYKAQKED
ncbi:MULTISPECIES: polysaccharide biosynthesis tyrosine autokinase [Acinetobacter calcoaceticus/baumannii complex]|jgi:tyrosine-protein kinase Etk/Wzc|uniref:polysaccharide biosynthesis tyrosine autokinase n=1 Tax=Acinetobacter calcoaceticus/baumannii complex TaxID=909768 RepID=UPI000451FC8B|nr:MULTISPECIES: polysaccharide biosynthesis tyrosine autokinase [Acinetobacter calcoaceticus/baumannii complex]EXS32096.1 tyrosine-protein kinase ptk [Acinetobacter sp. 826659]KRI64307.1 tyrosine protein kinase [Acinetobacter pittii]RSN94962.1 polysaccharide biosynthesis tyrosine autokinase [Acinetobacter pittii]RZG80171.1 polysaccharide biosynthesis tyrosine autokinase [Acinetobacter pittii]RZH51885.1 polysaccharide biosynthesis tyrosine autokinase [Acinetobacter pittii]